MDITNHGNLYYGSFDVCNPYGLIPLTGPPNVYSVVINFFDEHRENTIFFKYLMLTLKNSCNLLIDITELIFRENVFVKNTE